MRFPDYPSNREADEKARATVEKRERRQSRVMLSRETCLHSNSWVGIIIISLNFQGLLLNLGEQPFLCAPFRLFIDNKRKEVKE